MLLCEAHDSNLAQHLPNRPAALDVRNKGNLPLRKVIYVRSPDRD